MDARFNSATSKGEGEGEGGASAQKDPQNLRCLDFGPRCRRVPRRARRLLSTAALPGLSHNPPAH